jgi:hypothetical protein
MCQGISGNHNGLRKKAQAERTKAKGARVKEAFAPP